MKIPTKITVKRVSELTKVPVSTLYRMKKRRPRLYELARKGCLYSEGLLMREKARKALEELEGELVLEV